MPILNPGISIWDKMIVNFGDKPRMFVAEFESFVIPDDFPLTRISFNCPFLIDEDGNIDEHDGYHFYAISTLLAQNNDAISIPSKKIESDRTKLVIDEMKIVCNTKDLAIMLQVTVSNGIVDGRNKTIGSLDDIGVYIVSDKANRDTKWWNNFNIGNKPLRVYSSYDVKWFKNEKIFSDIQKDLKLPKV